MPATIPPPQDGRSGSISSGDSTSPTLPSSPLGSFGGITQALPSPTAGGGGGPQRSTSHRTNSSYESSVDALADDGTNDLAHEEDEALDALRRYRRASSPLAPLSCVF